jgi:hypothetical protein
VLEHLREDLRIDWLMERSCRQVDVMITAMARTVNREPDLAGSAVRVART